MAIQNDCCLNFRWVGLVLTLLLIAKLASPLFAAEGKHFWVYIGTYTRSGSQGIYVSRLDSSTGRLTPPELAAESVNPSFLAFHPGGRFLYAVGEVASLEGRKGGGVRAFAIDPATGKLSFLNQVSSQGAGPCHLTVDRSGRYVVVANYGSGNIAVLPLEENGRLREASDVKQHAGSGPNPKRQEGPHAHSVHFSPDNRFVFAADLGLDRIFIYQLDPATGKLSPNSSSYAVLDPGSGPRHFAFHPSGRLAFVINELASTVTSFVYDAKGGALHKRQTISTLPEGFSGENYTAEVQVEPQGKFLYGSNRGHDSIAVFSIHGKEGNLRAVEQVSTQGKWPRNFGIDPAGNWLVAANQNSNNLVAYRLDRKSGRLSPTGQVLQLASPVCVKFLPVP